MVCFNAHTGAQGTRRNVFADTGAGEINDSGVKGYEEIDWNAQSNVGALLLEPS